jgi:hypothetical protein
MTLDSRMRGEFYKRQNSPYSAYRPLAKTIDIHLVSNFNFMKNIAILSILFLSVLTAGVKNNYILIEYVGDGSKPISATYISTKPLPHSEQITTIGYSDFPTNYIVSNNEFLLVKKQIISTSRKTFEKKDYNGVKITIRENNSIVSYFITQKNSNSLFLKINTYLKQDKRNKDLILQLKCFIKTRFF